MSLKTVVFNLIYLNKSEKIKDVSYFNSESWEPKANLTNCKRLLNEYYERKRIEDEKPKKKRAKKRKRAAEKSKSSDKKPKSVPSSKHVALPQGNLVNDD